MIMTKVPVRERERGKGKKKELLLPTTVQHKNEAKTTNQPQPPSSGTTTSAVGGSSSCTSFPLVLPFSLFTLMPFGCDECVCDACSERVVEPFVGFSVGTSLDLSGMIASFQLLLFYCVYHCTLRIIH